MTEPVKIKSNLDSSSGMLSWLTDTDSRRLGLIYLITGCIALAAGLYHDSLVRIMNPDSVSGGLLSGNGIVLWFMCLIPALYYFAGNYLLPGALGMDSLSFPRLNLLSFYLWSTGIICLLIAMYSGVSSGSVLFSMSRVIMKEAYNGTAAAGIILLCASGAISAITFITSIHSGISENLKWRDLSWIVWGVYSSSLVLLAISPVLSTGVFLVVLESYIGTGLFDSALGGEPILLEHFSWFFLHPVKYVALLTGFGIISEIIETFTGKKLAGHNYLAACFIGAAVFSLLGWPAHMFSGGVSMEAALAGAFFVHISGAFLAVISVLWVVSFYKSRLSLKTPVLYAVAFIFTYSAGAVAAGFMSMPVTNVYLQNTLFSAGFFQYTVLGGCVTALMAGLHYWWPLMSGRMYNENLGRINVVVIFSGFCAAALPMLVMGTRGVTDVENGFFSRIMILENISLAGQILIFTGLMFNVVNFVSSMLTGKQIAKNNHWDRKSLEWEKLPAQPGRASENNGADKLGVVLFLSAEMLAFGALLGIFVLFRILHSSNFRYASFMLSDIPGAISTFGLIFCSFTLVIAARNAMLDNKKHQIISLILALLGSFAILIVRYNEYSSNIASGYLWKGMTVSSSLKDAYTEVFYSLYYLISGLHTIHVIAGVILLAWATVKVLNSNSGKNNFRMLETLGVYWHGILCIWLFIFPLLHLF